MFGIGKKNKREEIEEETEEEEENNCKECDEVIPKGKKYCDECREGKKYENLGNEEIISLSKDKFIKYLLWALDEVENETIMLLIQIWKLRNLE